MQKIANFMMSKKFLPIFLVLTAASLFIAYSTQGKNEKDNPKSKYAKVLRNVGIILEEGHYSPKKIDDNFSKTAFKKFIEDLDNAKNILLQSDIDALKKYETKIDDEIHGAEIKSFFDVNEIYLKRLNEASILFNAILAKPFEFTKDEAIQTDVEKLSFPKTLTERTEVWRKYLKYLVLSKFVDMQEEREKNSATKKNFNSVADSINKVPFKAKADSTLEREARDAVRKQMARYFTTKINRENTEENFSTFINAITGTMDPHTTYFAPVDMRSFNEGMSGSFFGIGAQLKDDDGKIKIASLISGGPAWKQGDLKVDDEIIKIAQANADPVDVTGYDVPDAVKLIRGATKGSEVRLTVKRTDGSIKVITLLRGKVDLEDTFAKSAIINGDKKIGYIYLPEFYLNFNDASGHKCSEDVANEIKKLKAENVDGIIMDLRNNGGGSLPEVVKMAGLFIQEGPICQVQSRGEKPYTWKDNDNTVLYDGPLTVMVNEFSASASEIFAAAIQDYKRGIVIGSTSTYGKGTVQRTIPLNPERENELFGNENKDDLGSIKLTLQKFYRVNGGSTQLKGVTPDIVLPDRFESLKFREKDNTLSLPWDEIAKVDYTTWTSTLTDNPSSYLKNSETTTLGKIKTTLLEMDKLNDKEYSLNSTKFKQEKKQLNATYKVLDSLFKLQKELVVKNSAADAILVDVAKDKVEKNNAWLKRLSNDIYIDESVKIMRNMIAQGSTAKVN
jgi:carboxyl-terminal processing protease